MKPSTKLNHEANQPRCGIIILAAGGSSRLGFAKQLVRVGGITLLRRIVTEALASACEPVVVVLGSQAEQMQTELAGLSITIAINDRWQAGMGSSIRTGVAALLAADSNIDAVLIALCDQPRITSAIFDRLGAAHFASGKTIAAAAYAGTLGTPAVFSSSLFTELSTLADNTGGRATIQRHAADVEPVAIPEAEIDVDTAEDLRRLDIAGGLMQPPGGG